MDLIDIQAAIDELISEPPEMNYGFYYAEKIKALPPAQPLTGEWLPDNINYYDERYICSRCGVNYKVDTCMGKPSWNFCPHCGAKMEGLKVITNEDHI